MSAQLRVVSFGYGHNEDLADYDIVPDITVDVRDWFRDPHIDPALREMTGLDQAVIDKVRSTPGVLDFVDSLYWAVLSLLRTGIRDVTVAIGCVGGRHRSVVIAQLLADRAAEPGRKATVTHLHVDRPVIRREADRG